jgi:hypothetical protein
VLSGPLIAVVVIAQEIVWSPQLAGVAPCLTAHGWMSLVPMPACVLGWAVMTIVWLLAGAGGPDAKAGEAPAAAMTMPPPAAATAVAVAASARPKRAPGDRPVLGLTTMSLH